MTKNPQALDEEPRKALASFIREFETEFYPWYERASRRAYFGWLLTWWIAVLAGFCTTVLGILTEYQILGGPWAKSLLLILPALGSLSAILLSRFIDGKALRERGRQTSQEILAEAKSGYASFGDNDKALTDFHNKLIERMTALEEQQLVGFLRTAQQGVGSPIGQSSGPT